MEDGPKDTQDSVTVQISHGTKKYSLVLEDFCKVTVAALEEMVEKETGVLVNSQKLIFRGKAMTHNSEELLSSLGIKEKSKIMLLGAKFDPTSESVYDEICQLEQTVNRVTKALSDINSEIDGIAKDFLPKDLAKESIGRLEKRVKYVSEDCFKTLELLDAILLGESSTEARSKRKSVVDKLQDLMNKSDAMLENLAVLSSKLKT